MFIRILFIMVKNQKQPIQPSLGEMISKLWHVCGLADRRVWEEGCYSQMNWALSCVAVLPGASYSASLGLTLLICIIGIITRISTSIYRVSA